MTSAVEAAPPIATEVGKAPAAWQRARFVVILGALSAFGPLSIDMYLPGLPELTDDLGTGAAQVQLTISACLLGLAFGQLVAGPLSDARGRRGPLLVGLAGYSVASLLCAVAPNVGALVTFRMLQGFAGAAGIVIARAIVRDLHSGVAAARFFSTLMLVHGLAPILAPVAGGQILRVTDWRGVFVVLAAIGGTLLLAAGAGLPETLPAERRQTGGVGGTLTTFGRLMRDRAFVGRALTLGLGSAGMLSYIAGSPFVLQKIYGVSPQVFSACFGLNALGLMIAGQVNRRLVGRVPPPRLLQDGLMASAAGGLALLAVVVLDGGLAMVLAALFLMVASLGFVFPNATALALSAHPEAAGSASALLGVVQFTTGAAVAPLVGIAGEATAVPMALVIAASAAAALLIFIRFGRTTGVRTED
jgi:DHA1 family bicyclomycin/chloramphenicol resistance-like MFS transporter